MQLTALQKDFVCNMRIYVWGLFRAFAALQNLTSQAPRR